MQGVRKDHEVVISVRLHAARGELSGKKHLQQAPGCFGSTKAEPRRGLLTGSATSHCQTS